MQWLAQRGTQARPACRRTLPVCCSSASPSVVATRERGKNGKLISALSKHGVQCLEVPLIEHAPGPDRDRLPELLQAGGYDWVTVTSPEAASVFLEGWQQAGRPRVRIAVVGGGTGEVLEAAGLHAEYTATKATGKVLGSELPHRPGGSGRVLYPASVLAGTDLQDALAAANYSVQRISTYDTVGVKEVAGEVLQQALAAPIITFGSPSAVKAWVALVGLEAAQAKTSVCIGSTSARACEAAGLTRVVFPDSPGIDGWAECVLQALGQPQAAAA